MKTCNRCGGLILTPGMAYATTTPICCCTRELSPPAAPAAPQGWVCPVCSAVHAPWVSGCQHGAPMKVTC